MKTEAATIQIGASPEAACAVLAGLGRYQEWNRSSPRRSGR
jgi:hypothetical protein